MKVNFIVFHHSLQNFFVILRTIIRLERTTTRKSGKVKNHKKKQHLKKRLVFSFINKFYLIAAPETSRRLCAIQELSLHGSSTKCINDFFPLGAAGNDFRTFDDNIQPKKAMTIAAIEGKKSPRQRRTKKRQKNMI